MLTCIRRRQVRIFSRNCTDYHTYADLMRPFVNELVDAEDCILDGEMVAWDSHKSAYIPFGHNRVRASCHRWSCCCYPSCLPCACRLFSRNKPTTATLLSTWYACTSCWA